jgi:hypothetical protein
MGPGSAAHHAAKSGALRSIRGTHPLSLPQLQTRLRDPAARCARVVAFISRPENKGRGECRMPAAPSALTRYRVSHGVP